MRYHDFHLQGYEVKDAGQTVILNLIYDYPDIPKEFSCITFSEVTLYDFNHTTGAIITNIDEQDILALVKEKWVDLQHWNNRYGIHHWESSPEKYSDKLRSCQYKAYKAWEITSALGFYGFIIAKNLSSAHQKKPLKI